MKRTINAPLLLFDGDCHFCDRSVQFIITFDKQETFHFAALQSKLGQSLLKQGHLPTTNFDSIVLIKADEYYTKSAAILQICKELGGIWSVFYFFKFIPTPLRDGIYQLIAKNRHKFTPIKKQCKIPSPSVRKRFLS